FHASALANAAVYGSAAGLKVTTGPGASDFVVVDFAGETLEVGGSVRLSIANFVFLHGQFAISQASGQQVTLTDATTKQVNVLKIGASGVDAFVGVGAASYFDTNGGVHPDGA